MVAGINQIKNVSCGHVKLSNWRLTLLLGLTLGLNFTIPRLKQIYFNPCINSKNNSNNSPVCTENNLAGRKLTVKAPSNNTGENGLSVSILLLESKITHQQNNNASRLIPALPKPCMVVTCTRGSEPPVMSISVSNILINYQHKSALKEATTGSYIKDTLPSKTNRGTKNGF